MKLSLISLCLVLGGCSSLDIQRRDFPPSMPATSATATEQSRLTETWGGDAMTTEGRASVVLIAPQSLPPSVRDKRVSLELEPGVTVLDMVAILGRLGVTAVISDPEIADKTFYLPRYNGTVGGLLSAITRATDVWFTWHEGTIVVAAHERISVSVPQEPGFGEALSKGLESLGITKGTSVSWQAGMAVLDITPSQFRKVKLFLERYTANAAVISLQVAVVNVSLNQNAKQGIDWQALQLAGTAGGTLQDLAAWKKGTAAATTAVVAPTTPVGAAAATVAAVAARATGGAGLASGALTGALFSDRFSFGGVFNFLETYGTAETRQNVMLKTVAGTKVEFKSITSVPYVSEIGSVTTNTNAAATTAGSTKTARADDGITVELTPYFDAAANSVTVDFKLSIKAVVSFTELSAGADLGTLKLPTTAERSFTDSLRLKPGQTVVIGGLAYDSYSSNKAAPLPLADTAATSESLTVTRQNMFIVVRPTVVKLGQMLSQESGESLELLSVGAPVIEPVEPKVDAKPAARQVKKPATVRSRPVAAAAPQVTPRAVPLAALAPNVTAPVPGPAAVSLPRPVVPAVKAVGQPAKAKE